MNPIEFKEQNIVFAKDQPEYQPLPAHKSADGTVVSCWQLDEQDLENIKNNGGLIYLSQKTFNQPLQPLFPSTVLNLDHANNEQLNHKYKSTIVIAQTYLEAMEQVNAALANVPHKNLSVVENTTVKECYDNGKMIDITNMVSWYVTFETL